MLKRLTKSVIAAGADGLAHMAYGRERQTDKDSFYELEAELMSGEKKSMADYRDNVVIVVNVASFWGLTDKNYKQLVALHDKYASDGLVILAFPCNQFGAQEPKSHEEILAFARKYKGSDGKGADEKFVFFAKSDVNGSNTNEVFSFLKRELPWADGSKEVRWNFGKFLVGRDGLPAKRFGSKDAPLLMEDDIVELIGQGAAEPTTPLAKTAPKPTSTPQGVTDLDYGYGGDEAKVEAVA